MRSDCFFAAALLLLFALGGCASVGDYPPNWPEMVGVEPGRCPIIDGRYANDQGVVVPCEPPDALTPAGRKCRFDSLLASNILAAHSDELPRGDNYPFIDIRQPDENTLNITLGDDRGPITLKRGEGDFICDSDGLTISSYWTLTERGMVVQQRLRSFRRAVNGSLLMTVTSSFGAVVSDDSTGPLAVPSAGGRNDVYYVRWNAAPRETLRKP